ncbi:hypothetical protein CTA2_10708 [Colletotrichum tanaceti]|nr:hypothetical protein CTA2_10708 [Colletotrichum tanaceti]
MPTLFRLRMPLGQRVSLVVLFGLGTVVVVAGVMRTYWIMYCSITFAADPAYDITWEGFNIWVWTALEANLGVVCGCAPALRRLFTAGGGGKGDETPPAHGSVLTIGSPGQKRKKVAGTQESRQENDEEEHGLTGLPSQSMSARESSVTKLV